MRKDSKFPKEIRIVEVGPRDGLQNEKTVISADDKATFIRKLASSGHKSIEVTSFVRPDMIPQMSDAKELFPLVSDLSTSVNLACLVPNLKGLDLAIELGVKEIAVFTASSDSFNQRNINATVSQSFDRIQPVVEKALAANIKVRGYASTAFGCPYEGEIKADKTVEVAVRLKELGCYEISLGDTIGSGSPASVADVLDLLLLKMPVENIALHFHDTRGMAIANCLKGLEFGVSVFDASAGGLGGCPYAKGATGNLASEDLIYLCHTLGIKTGIDLSAHVKASEFMLKKLNKKTTSKFLQAYQVAEGELFLPGKKV